MSAANKALFIHTILDQVISELHWTHCAKCWRTHFGIDIHLRGGTSLYGLYNCLLVSKFWASVVIEYVRDVRKWKSKKAVCGSWCCVEVGWRVAADSEWLLVWLTINIPEIFPTTWWIFQWINGLMKYIYLVLLLLLYQSGIQCSHVDSVWPRVSDWLFSLTIVCKRIKMKAVWMV